jgi:hypothetical protein
VLGHQTGRVGTEPEEGGVPQRHDSGIAEDQVERDRKEADDGDLVEDQVAAGKQEERGGRGKPEQDLADVPAGAAAKRFGDLGDAGSRRSLRLRPHQRARAKSPCGRRTRTAIMSA